MEVSNGMIQSGEENNTVKENSESGNSEGKWQTLAKSRSNTGSESNHFLHSKLLLFYLRNSIEIIGLTMSNIQINSIVSETFACHYISSICYKGQ